MATRRSSPCWPIWVAVALASVATRTFPAEPPVTEASPGWVLTSADAVRELTPAQAAQKVLVRLRGVVTFFFNTRSCFVQDETAGIYVGGGAEVPELRPGDLVLIEGVSGSGEYAPIVSPSKLELLGHTNLPPPRQVSFEDLMTGREDSQWVEVSGLVRAVHGDPLTGQTLEIASGGGKLTASLSPSIESNLVECVDSRLRVRGVCGSWFNKRRQLFGVRLLVPRPEDIILEPPPATNTLAAPAIPIGDLLRFAPHASYGHRVRVAAT